MFHRKRVWPLVVSGFLFSCLHIYGQLPESETRQNRHSRIHEGHLILVSDEDGEWVVDIAHSLSRAWDVKVGSRRPSLPDKIDFDSKQHNVSIFLQRKRNRRQGFHSDKKRSAISMRDNSYSSVVDNTKKSHEFVRIAGYTEHGNKTHGVTRSVYISAGVKDRDKRGEHSASVRPFMADPNSPAETNQKQVGLRVNIGSDQDKSSQQQLNIFFLKVHKAASTTVHNVVMRFALSNNLDVMLPKSSNILSETGYMVKSDNLHPYPPSLKFNVICNHVIFNQEYLSRFLKFPKSTIYFGIVREPFSQFASAFYYYLNKFQRRTLVNIAMDNPEHPIRGFLQNPLKHVDAKNYASSVSFINNRMSVDFGFPMWFMEEDKQNDGLIKKFLNKTEQIFHLVMVVDLFEESILLLRKLLNWTIKDVLYIQSNTFERLKQEQTLHFPWKVNTNFTEEDRRLHRMYARVDYALYNHFRNLLLLKLQNQPPEFKEEVRMFKNILREVTSFCRNDEHQRTDDSELIIPANLWTEEFTVSLADCKFIQMSELELVGTARDRQKARYIGQ